MVYPDSPRVRASRICPLCGGAKDNGLICCWRCYHVYGLRDGNNTAEQKIADEEMRLEGLEQVVNSR